MSMKEAARPIVQQLEEDYKRSTRVEILEKALELAKDATPEGWEAGIGERNGETYTKPFYHKQEDIEVELYYDELGDDQHKIVFYKVKRNEFDDAEGSEQVATYYASTEEQATEKAFRKMEKYNGGELEL